MAYYYIRKVAGFLVTLFLVSILTFAVFQILPGDPALVILGVDADEMQIQQLHEEMGWTGPFPFAFWSGSAACSRAIWVPLTGIISPFPS